jgi:hypothetical protein
MNFLNRDEAERRKASLRRRLVGDPRPVFCYESDSERDFLSAARAFIASFGGFREATLLYVSSPFGDGWHETLVADTRWAHFRRWREAHGEVRRLYDAPGQQFAADEGDALAEAIAFALLLGWDAWLDSNLGRKLIVFSHDDRVEVHRGCERRILTHDLLRLGYWRIAGSS